MPRYYFDVCEGVRFIPDDEGFELDGPQVAERMAMRAAADMARDSLPKGDADDVAVEVHDQDDKRVLTVTVAMRVERAVLKPRAVRYLGFAPLRIIRSCRLTQLLLSQVDRHQGFAERLGCAQLPFSEGPEVQPS